LRARLDLEKVRDIHVRSSKDVASLVDQMWRSGGFMAKNVAESARILQRMGADHCTKFLSFPAALVATGSRGVLIDMVREGLVDVIITASGTLDHDIARTYADYYHGSFSLDDTQLHRDGYHRLGNVVIPIDNYGPLIEKKVQGWLSALYMSGRKSVGSEELCRLFGKELNSRSSLLYWAFKNKVPVFVPGIMDGAVGSQIWLFAERHRDFKVDVIEDERRLSEIVSESKRTGGMVIGGGISKHHLLWWNLFKGGLDYACYITTAVEYDGSLSGAQVREAISWGKVKERAKSTTLYADATTVLPLIVSYAITKSRK
jgi:deoxyhypusine synthase